MVWARIVTHGCQFRGILPFKTTSCSKMTLMTIMTRLTPISTQKLCVLDLLVIISADTCDATPLHHMQNYIRAQHTLGKHHQKTYIATSDPSRCTLSTSIPIFLPYNPLPHVAYRFPRNG